MKTLVIKAHTHGMPIHLIILIGALLFMLQPLGTDLYLPSMPALALDFGIGIGQVAQTMTSFVIGFATSQLVAGPITDRFGRRPSVLVGLSIFILATLMCALAPDFNTLLIARFFQATGACTCFVVARAIVRDCFEAKDAAWVVSKINSFMIAAPITGVLLGGFLVSLLGWRFNFYALMVFGMVVWGVVYLKLQETLAPKDMQNINLRNLWRSYQIILSNPIFLSFTAVAFAACAGLFCHLAASSTIYVRILGQTPLWYGVCFAFGCVGYLLGTILLRRWIVSLHFHQILLRAGIIQVASMSISIALAQWGFIHWSVIAGCNFVFLMGYGITMSACQAGAITPFPNRAGTAGSLMGAIQISGGALAAWWMGFAYNASVFPMIGTQWVCGAAVMLLAATAVKRVESVA